MRFWIWDEDSTPQGLPLKLLIESIASNLDLSRCEFWILRSDGYGLKVNEWDRALDKKERLLVTLESILMLSEGREELFYNLNVDVIMNNTLKVRFGLHDSSALYVEGSQKICESIVQVFTKVETQKS